MIWIHAKDGASAPPKQKQQQQQKGQGFFLRGTLLSNHCISTAVMRVRRSVGALARSVSESLVAVVAVAEKCLLYQTRITDIQTRSRNSQRPVSTDGYSSVHTVSILMVFRLSSLGSYSVP